MFHFNTISPKKCVGKTFPARQSWVLTVDNLFGKSKTSGAPDNQGMYKSCRIMGKPRLESVNDVVELVVESPAWNKKECNEKQLEEMDPTFRNVVDTHYKS